VPRNTVYRFRVPADRDLSELLSLLIERHVQVLEIRQCTEPGPRTRTPADGQAETSQPAAGAAEAPGTPGGVVVPFPGRPGLRPAGGRPAG